MALSNIDKCHLDELMLSLYEDDNKLELLKSNHSSFAQLKLLAQQIHSLKLQAKRIIDNSELQQELHKITKNFKLVSGKTYYVYYKDGEIDNKFFSLLSPEDWSNERLVTNKMSFVGRYYYDYDKQFVLDDYN